MSIHQILPGNSCPEVSVFGLCAFMKHINRVHDITASIKEGMVT